MNTRLTQKKPNKHALIDHLSTKRIIFSRLIQTIENLIKIDVKFIEKIKIFE